MSPIHHILDKWHSRYTSIASSSSHLLLFLIRTYWGYQFFLTGWGKLNNLEGVTAFFEELGVPFPAANAAFVGSLEMIGGLFLIVGLASRYVTLPLIVILSVAYATDDSEALINIWTDPESFFGAAPFLFLLSTVMVYAFGAGIFSIDFVLGRSRAKWRIKARDRRELKTTSLDSANVESIHRVQ